MKLSSMKLVRPHRSSNNLIKFNTFRENDHGGTDQTNKKTNFK